MGSDPNLVSFHVLVIFTYSADESLIRTCGKFWVLDDILPKLKASGHRVLIFSQMVKLLNILEVIKFKVIFIHIYT